MSYKWSWMFGSSDGRPGRTRTATKMLVAGDGVLSFLRDERDRALDDVSDRWSEGSEESVVEPRESGLEEGIMEFRRLRGFLELRGEFMVVCVNVIGYRGMKKRNLKFEVVWL